MEITEEQSKDIKWALEKFKSLADGYKLARDYYDGKHRLIFNSEKFKNAFGGLFASFADNTCPAICETLKDRLKLDGFTLPKDAAIEKDIAELWRRNRMKVRANQVHLDAIIEGDCYLLVWPDAEGTPIFYPNRGSAVVIEYDDEQPGLIVKAAKTWTVQKDGKQRLTLFYPDRIEKYVTTAKIQGGLPDNHLSFIEFETPGEAWPLPNPYDKVPVFHFGNRAGIGNLGTTELSEVIPLQDALNKSIGDMLVNSEFYGIPQRWATGVDTSLTDADIKKAYQLVAGGVWATDKGDAKFGNFQSGDIDKHITVIENFRKEIARAGRTPLHYFDSSVRAPSGEALKTLEAPLLAKVSDRQETWGPVWSDAMRFALQITGKGDFEPEPNWIDTTPRSDLEQVTIATGKQALGIPNETLWEELNYSPEQIDAMKKQIAAQPPLKINPAGAARNGFQSARPNVAAMFAATNATNKGT